MRPARDRRRGSAGRVSSRASTARWRRLASAAIVLAGFATYWNSLDAPFVWDDQTAIVSNQTIRRLWPPWEALTPPRETPMAGRPIVNLTLAMNHAVGGLDVTGYRVMNVAVHVGCALLLFGVVRLTLTGARLRQSFGNSADGTAFAAALVWVVHPLQSDAVDYVTQRTESLMAFFLLMTLYCAIRGRRSIEPRRWEMAAVASCALGAACKESMIVAPAVVLLYDGTFEFASMGGALRARRGLYGGLAATWVEVGLLMWRWPRSTVGFDTPVGPWTYLLNQVQMVVQYLRLSVWPRALVLDYGVPQPTSLGAVAPDALIMLFLLCAAVVALFRWPAAGFLGMAFFLTLAPTSSVVPINSEVGAERRMYLPMMALSILAVAGGRLMLDRADDRARSRPRMVMVAGLMALVAIVTGLATRTVLRNREYADPVSLWRTVVDRRPHGRARFAYASALVDAGYREQAIGELRQAVDDYEDARYALGVELYFAGSVDDSIRELRRFIERKPSDPTRIPARSLLARGLVSKGDLEGAAEQLRLVLEVAPSDAEARTGLADVLMSQARFDEAVREYRTVAGAVQSAAIEAKLGLALIQGGQLEEAAERLDRALQLAPELASAHRSLAQVQLRLGRRDQALSHAQQAVKLEPGNPLAQNLLGAALASDGRLEEAIEHFREASRLDPNDRQARENLTLALGLVKARATGPTGSRP